MRPKSTWVPGSDEEEGFYLPEVTTPIMPKAKQSKSINPFPLAALRPIRTRRSKNRPKYQSFTDWVMSSPEASLISWFIMLLIVLVFLLFFAQFIAYLSHSGGN